MPHMMPMMWIMIYLFTLIFLLITISLLYFFYIPKPPFLPKLNQSKSRHKWIWLW